MKVLVPVLVALCMATSMAFAADMKIGYIEMQRALESSEAGKEAKELLASRMKNYQDQINAKQDDLKRLKDDFEKQGMILSESARANKEKDYQQKLKEFQRFTKDAEDDLRAKQDESVRKILEGMEKIIQEFGRTKGYTFIFVRNESMLFVDEKADLTNEVLKLLNASRKK